jgi:hypothetical protein
MAVKLTKDQQMAAIMAHQDQDIEDAKKWLGRNGDGKDSFNAQATALWSYCCSDQPTEIEDIMSRFAIIGIRHVLSQMNDSSGR